MTDGSFAGSAKVNEASGMISIQAHCTFAEAVVLVRKRAEQMHSTAEGIAGLVLDCTIRFGV